MLSRAFLLALLALPALPGREQVDAAPTADSGIIADPGPEWQPTQPIAGAVAPEVVTAWWNGSDLLSIFSVPNDACGPQGMDSRTQMSLVAVTFGIPHKDDRDGVSRYDNGGRPGAVLDVFQGSDHSFAILIFSETSSADMLSDKLDRVSKLQIQQAGGVIAPPEQSPSRLDELILARDPVSGSAAGADVAVNSFGCTDGDAAPVVQFLKRNTEERTKVFTDPSGSIVTVTLSDYPFELFAATSVGARLSSDNFVDASVPGLDALPDASASIPVTSPQQILVRMRRGRIELLVSAFAPTQEQAQRIAVSYAVAQNKLLPDGPTSVFVPPSPARSALDSGLLVGLVGVATIGTRRLRAGRTSANADQQLRSNALAANQLVSVDQLAKQLRRHGRTITAVQMVLVAGVIVGVASDIGDWRWLIGVTGLVLGIAVTWFGRRQEDRLLGDTGRRSRPRPSLLAGLTLVIAIGVLVAAGWLLISGLREVLFTPSLSHLQLADRLDVEPRRLAWIMVGVGLALLFAGAFLSRAARALARIGWRRDKSHAGEVVYLRSFGDDQLRLRSTLSARRPFVEWFNVRGREPFEESIAWELAVIGPVIAIGRPGASRATLGAAREHISDADWQQTIAERMSSAQLIAVTIGATAGLTWELSHIAQHGHLDKCVFVVPPTSHEDASLRWVFTRASLVAAGAPIVDLPQLPVGTLILRTYGDAPSQAYVAARCDEAEYRAAIALAT
ncbi:MAG TPA: hypothetical protein VFE86_03615 [Ilumatobacteraceae bacterium]|nr:hypothetical protein [Ilumatobacteraceae bacterium]